MGETFKRTGDLSLEIGDELYFNDPKLQGRTDLTYRNTFTDAVIQVTVDEDDNVPFAAIYISQQDKEKPDIFYTPEDESINSRAGEMDILELGCDTASYQVNGNDVHTGADGGYGFVATAENSADTFIMLNGGWNYTSLPEFRRIILHALDMDEAKHTVNG